MERTDATRGGSAKFGLAIAAIWCGIIIGAGGIFVFLLLSSDRTPSDPTLFRLLVEVGPLILGIGFVLALVLAAATALTR
jgi:hypothetical protein